MTTDELTIHDNGKQDNCVHDNGTQDDCAQDDTFYDNKNNNNFDSYTSIVFQESVLSCDSIINSVRYYLDLLIQIL